MDKTRSVLVIWPAPSFDRFRYLPLSECSSWKPAETKLSAEVFFSALPLRFFVVASAHHSVCGRQTRLVPTAPESVHTSAFTRGCGAVKCFQRALCLCNADFTLGDLGSDIGWHVQSIKTALGEDNLKRFINFVLAYLATVDIPVKRCAALLMSLNKHSHTPHRQRTRPDHECMTAFIPPPC